MSKCMIPFRTIARHSIAPPVPLGRAPWRNAGTRELMAKPSLAGTKLSTLREDAAVASSPGCREREAAPLRRKPPLPCPLGRMQSEMRAPVAAFRM